MIGQEDLSEESKANELKKKNLFLLIGGIILLVLPLLIILFSKLSSLRNAKPSQMNGSMFYARTLKVGQKLTPAPAPAPSGTPSGLTPPTQSSLGMVVGYKTPPAPPAPKPKIKAKKASKKVFQSKSLAQLKAKKPAQTVQPVSIPHLKPSPFGNPASQGGSPISAPGAGQVPNAGSIIQNVMKGMPQGQSMPPNVQQMIQQATQGGGAPAVPPPTGQ
jgi:hypothetical protein